MTKISKPQLSSAKVLTPLEMNAIHFGGNHTPLTPENLRSMIAAKSSAADGSSAVSQTQG